MARVFEGMFIGGGWSATKQTFKDYNPADGSVWAEVPDSGRAETAAAIFSGGVSGRNRVRTRPSGPTR